MIERGQISAKAGLAMLVAGIFGYAGRHIAGVAARGEPAQTPTELFGWSTWATF